MFCDISPTCYKIALQKEIIKRHIKNFLRHARYADTRQSEPLPCLVADCSSHLIKRGKGIDPVLQVAEGYTVDLPTEVDKTLLDRTDPTWPSTWFAPILTCIRSWPTGAPTTERGPTAIWGRTCSPWRA